MSALEPGEEVFDAAEGSLRTDLFLAAIIIAASFAMALFLVHGDDPRPRLMFALVGLLAGAAAVLQPLRRVRAGPADFTVEYILRRRVVRYSEIANVEIQLRPRGKNQPPLEVVVVTRTHGFPLTLLANFEDGAISVHLAINSRWMKWYAHVHGHAPVIPRPPHAEGH